MKRYYYTAESAHGSESSHGFSNDTIVLVWESRAARQQYLDNVRNLSARAIRRDEVADHAANWSVTENRDNSPRPFSNECWIIRKDDTIGCPGNTVEGLVGYVTVEDSRFLMSDDEKFYGRRE